MSMPQNPSQPASRPAPPTARPLTAAPLAQGAPAIGRVPPQAATAQPAPMATQQASAAQANQGGQNDGEPMPAQGSRFVMFTAMPSWLVSMVVHIVAILIMGLITVGIEREQIAQILTIGNDRVTDEVEEFKLTEITPIDVKTVSTDPVAQPLAMDAVQEVTEVAVATDTDAAQVAVELSDFGERTAPKSDLTKTVGAIVGSGVAGRGEKARNALVRESGGTPGSEAAVAAALKWFANHQYPDGGWSFDHRRGQCQGRCDGHGAMADARNAATAMALLPFLGAGQTHKEGTYKDNVSRGLYFLTSQMKLQNNGATGTFEEGGGNMYSHGLASIVLCEAYAMTHDKQLMGPAQLAINHIVFAQDPVGGGWRYSVKQAGDTSAVGWQLMALKSGHMAYLNVPPETIRGATKFLDSVQAESGAKYGYTGPGAGQATTAIGLLCRMYLGWKQDNPALQRGVEYLAATGPSKAGNMYYNYYATQVMRHNEGDPAKDAAWKKWNTEMREWLISTQSKNGHTEGSWEFKEGADHGIASGGRTYATSMATMILEVYYRHMPIYGKAAAKEDFPL